MKFTLSTALAMVLCLPIYAEQTNEAAGTQVVIKSLSPKDSQWTEPSTGADSQPLDPTLEPSVLVAKQADHWFGSIPVNNQDWVTFSADQVNLQVGAVDSGTGSRAGIKFTLDPGYTDLTLTFQIGRAGDPWGNNKDSFDATYEAHVYGFNSSNNSTELGTWQQEQAETQLPKISESGALSVTVNLPDNNGDYDSYGLIFVAKETTSLISGGGVSVNISNININGTPLPAPEPATAGLALLGLSGLCLRRRK